MGLDIFVKHQKQQMEEDFFTNWRKINFIFSFLWLHDIDTSEINCTDLELDEVLTTDLLERCVTILIVHHELPNSWQDIAEELLPTSQGFFFGSYEYDEEYIKDIGHVVKTILLLYDKYGTYELSLHFWW